MTTNTERLPVKGTNTLTGDWRKFSHTDDMKTLLYHVSNPKQIKFLAVAKAATSFVENLEQFVELISISIVSCSNLKATIPESITTLSKLKEITISNCRQLTGPIPSLTNFLNLRELQLSNNALSGELPEFGPLIHLTSLRLEQNMLTGPIPESITNLQSLQVLKLNDNRLEGEIDVLTKLVHLKYLWLHNNKFTCQVPRAITNLHNLISLRLNDNLGIDGEFPSFINGLAKLRELILSSTNITFNESMNFASLKSLEKLDLNELILSTSVLKFCRDAKITEFPEVIFDVHEEAKAKQLLRQNSIWKENSTVEEVPVIENKVKPNPAKDAEALTLIKETLEKVANANDEEISNLFLSGAIPFSWSKTVEHFKKNNEALFTKYPTVQSVENETTELQTSLYAFKQELANAEEDLESLRKQYRETKMKIKALKSYSDK